MVGKKVGWKYQRDDLYSAALILTEKPERININISIIIEPLKPWRPVERVNEKVVRRRKDGSL